MKKVFASVVLLSGLATQVNAMEAPAISFADLDINNNGALSVAEAGNLPNISEQWNSLDLNGDGQLSQGEFAGYQAPAPAAGTK